MRNAVDLIIQGNPVPKGRPRVTKSGYAYTPKRTKKYEDLIKWNFKLAKGEKLKGPLRAEFTFNFAMPKSWSKKKKLEMLGQPHTQRPDVDNLVKVIDALNGLAFDDDSQIYESHEIKLWANDGATRIYIEETEVLEE